MTFLSTNLEIACGVVPCVNVPLQVQLRNNGNTRAVVRRHAILAEVHLVSPTLITTDLECSVCVRTSLDNMDNSTTPVPKRRRVFGNDQPLPEDLQGMVDACEDVTPDQRTQIEKLVREYIDIFAHNSEIELCPWERFRIDTESGEKPTADTAVSLGSSARTLWNTLEMRDGVLYRRWEDERGDTNKTRYLLVLPQNRVRDVIMLFHAAPGSGSHFGVRKTLDKIKQRYYWPQAFQDCRDVIAACTECARTRGTGRGRKPGPMKIFNDNTFLGRWTIDFAGPFPPPTECPTYGEAARIHKKWYALVAVESFTCWPEVIITHSQTAEVCARLIVDNIVSRYGAFTTLHSDQGRNWEANLFKDVLNLFHIRKTRTSGYYPKGNGRCERFIKSLIQHLAVVVRHDQRDWTAHIPLLLLAYRSARHDTTRVSPAEMLCGRMLNLPVDLLREPPPGNETCIFNNTTSNYPWWLRDTLRRIHTEARLNREEASRRMKENYDVHTALFPGREGDLVWLYRQTKKRGHNPKLSRRWDGLHLILDRISDLDLRIEDVETGKRRIVNVQDVSPYDTTEAPFRSAWLELLS
ncbi:hypothetical protein ONE63_011112 [Megalurothrips usitatus]|uniref:RNA-directed DNA polymerase n=1 Tax=Megalurothrips usitatus TaxID=439358 RepID=A0AAV7XMH9_9NEOP|nr:hypothetical protein ONE63_011112 [Megalurothrips usitatus]